MKLLENKELSSVQVANYII